MSRCLRTILFNIPTHQALRLRELPMLNTQGYLDTFTIFRSVLMTLPAMLTTGAQHRDKAHQELRYTPTPVDLRQPLPSRLCPIWPLQVQVKTSETQKQILLFIWRHYWSLSLFLGNLAVSLILLLIDSPVKSLRLLLALWMRLANALSTVAAHRRYLESMRALKILRHMSSHRKHAVTGALPMNIPTSLVDATRARHGLQISPLQLRLTALESSTKHADHEILRDLFWTL